MPLLEVAAAQAPWQHNFSTLKPSSFFNSNSSCQFYPGVGRKVEYLNFEFPGRVCNHQVRRRSAIKAVATFESNNSVTGDALLNGRIINTKGGIVSVDGSENNEDNMDERERIRRMRISHANKGNTPWNKGRKHTPETLQRIRERTRLAMQDPKVKMKLANLGHAQSDETKLKIAVGVRLGWQKRREKLMLQEMCYFDWQNLVAEASRKGCSGEKKLQWDSYNVLREKLEVEWMESVEIRKTTKSISSRRAPKSAEQKKKIAEAIAAKWADPEYRERVCMGISKYHGSSENTAPRKPKRTSTETSSSPKQSRTRLKETMDMNPTSKPVNSVVAARFRKSKAPAYKDPLAKSKLEMLKNIRAQRAAEENKKVEAIERARLLIAEAEKAADALEAAARRSPVARASLLETRKLIAQAVSSIESVSSSMIADGMEAKEESVVNGVPFKSSEKEESINGNKNMNGFASSFLQIEHGEENHLKQINGVQLNGLKPDTEDFLETSSSKKKWVRGRLV